METITLTKPITVKGKEVDKIELDFNSVTGQDMINAETEARAAGDQSPSVLLSMKYQAALAAKIIGISYDDVIGMPGEDFKKIVLPVANFLLS